jgi:hypothetical protein
LKALLDALVENCGFPDIPQSADRDLVGIAESQRRSFTSFRDRMKASVDAGIAKRSAFEAELATALERWSWDTDELGSGF